MQEVVVGYACILSRAEIDTGTGVLVLVVSRHLLRIIFALRVMLMTMGLAAIVFRVVLMPIAILFAAR